MNKPYFRAEKISSPPRLFYSRPLMLKTAGSLAIGSLLVFVTACGTGSSGLTSSASTTKASAASQSPSPTPTPSKIAGTACTSEKATRLGAGETYICALDQAGKLVWLDSASATKLAEQRAAEAAAKAAAEKAAADAAAKAAAEKAAADAAAKAAADKAAADQAAAAQAAADKAAAEKAAADQAAAAKAAPPAQSGCDPNYSGCVPVASDVDCAGGKGNGPAYVRGPVTVVGSDIYDLDSDNDGIACEK